MDITQREVSLIRETAIKDAEDMIHDITGAPEEMLLRLGVERKIMLDAAEDFLAYLKSI